MFKSFRHYQDRCLAPVGNISQQVPWNLWNHSNKGSVLKTTMWTASIAWLLLPYVITKMTRLE